MASTFKVLGQGAPSALTLTDIYTVPGSASAVVSSVVVANRGGSQTWFRLGVAPDGEADANKHYVAYGTPLPANDTIVFTIGMTLSELDVIRAYGDNNLLSVTVFGDEVT